MQEAKAYAASIYLMAGMPYLLLMVLGVLFYRSMKKAKRLSSVPASAAGPTPDAPGAPGTLPT